MTERLLIFVGGLALLCAGCGKSDEPASCKAVGEHAAALMQDAVPEAKNPATAEAVTALLGPLKAGIVKQCEADGWPPAVRDCFASAKTLAAADACAAKTSPPAAN